VIHALGLNPRTVAQAIKIIRANAHRSDGGLQPSSPPCSAISHEQTVTTSDFADVSTQSC
jgi:hypothetical protein